MNKKKISTPIFDFVNCYKNGGVSRFHMPGHKGKAFVGCEAFDITEIDGADVLYSADGIIDESENNATDLFGSGRTFYSAQGSTLAIKAMLALAVNGKKGKKTVLASRNAHKAFIYGCALIDIEPQWIYPKENTCSICSCIADGEDVREALVSCKDAPCAVYITSPDYLGNVADIKSIAQVCHEFGVALLVDNAHGAYLKFLKEDIHPITLGADMCCDSAHKTLPVLTGGAYLHISKNADSRFAANARNMLSLFASTSPSYLILQSLDICNRYLGEEYAEKLAARVSYLDNLKSKLLKRGFVLAGNEGLKLTVDAKSSGFEAKELVAVLREEKCEIEFCDDRFAVMMITPENDARDLERLEAAFERLTPKSPIIEKNAVFPRGERVMSVREAMFAPRKKVRTQDAVGKICSCPCVSCPPAIPISVSGERITAQAAELFEKYGIDEIETVIE